MEKLVKGEMKPYIFHMSWTENKVNKMKLLQQLGEWYVRDQCVTKSVDQIFDEDRMKSETIALDKACCLAEPVVQCHYRNKPSKIPCLWFFVIALRSDRCTSFHVWFIV